MNNKSVKVTLLVGGLGLLFIFGGAFLATSAGSTTYCNQNYSGRTINCPTTTTTTTTTVKPTTVPPPTTAAPSTVPSTTTTSTTASTTVPPTTTVTSVPPVTTPCPYECDEMGEDPPLDASSTSIVPDPAPIKFNG